MTKRRRYRRLLVALGVIGYVMWFHRDSTWWMFIAGFMSMGFLWDLTELVN